MNTASVQIIELQEYAAPESVKIDEEKGIIHGVKFLGLKSANGRRYLKEAVSRALPLYEGRVINLDHPLKPGETISVTRRFGWLKDVYQGEDGGGYGNLHYLKSHPSAPPIIESAKRNPSLMGLSHHAKGRERQTNGESVIETIESVISVDLVADPATVTGFFESKDVKPMKKKISQLIEELKEKRPGYSKALQEMAEAGLMSPGGEMDEPAPAESPTDTGDHEDALKQGFKSAIHAVVDDDGMDMGEKLSKIKEILKAQEKLLAKKEPEGGGKSGEGSDDSGKDDGKDKEKDKKEEGKSADQGNLVESLKLQNEILQQCIREGVNPSKVLEKALSACKTLEEAKELIADFKASRPVPSNKPRSAAGKSITESKDQNAEVPTDPKKWASFVRS